MKAGEYVYPLYEGVADLGISARDYVALHILAAYCAEMSITEWDADARLRAARAAFRMADSFIEASQEEQE